MMEYLINNSGGIIFAILGMATATIFQESVLQKV